MQVRRAKSALALSHIKDLTVQEELPKDVYLGLLGQRLNDPELSKQTFVVIGIDDENKNKVIGHLVAIAEPNVEWVWIYEAVYDPKIGVEKATEVTMKVREAVISWANFLGRPSLRMQTFRDPEAWIRKWGMKVLASVMELRLDTVLNEQIFEEIELHKENENERINSDKGIGADGRAAAHSRGTGEVHLGGEAEPTVESSGSGSIGVSGAIAGEDRAGDASSGSSGTGVESSRELAEVHERYLASVERDTGL